MKQFMRIEWNDENGDYFNRVLEHDEAWAKYYELQDKGIAAGIESMSAFELEQHQNMCLQLSNDHVVLATKLVHFEMRARLQAECQKLNKPFDEQKFNDAFMDMLLSDAGKQAVEKVAGQVALTWKPLETAF